MKLFTNIFILAIIYFIINRILHIDVIQFSKKSVDASFGLIGNYNARMHRKNMQKAELSKSKSIAKSKIYILIEGIILDNNFKDVTVEGVFTTVLLASMILNGLLYLVLKNILIFIFGTAGVIVFLFTILFITGSETYYKRQYSRMDAEDLITSSLKNGVIAAVKDNVELMSDNIKKPYQDFLNNISMKISPAAALEILGKDLGHESLPFINQLIAFDKFERKGSLDIFKDMSKENTNKRFDMMDMQMFLRDLNSMYLKTLAITGALLIFMVLPNPVMLEMLLRTTLGNLAILANFCLIVFGFARIQKFRN